MANNFSFGGRERGRLAGACTAHLHPELVGLRHTTGQLRRAVSGVKTNGLSITFVRDLVAFLHDKATNALHYEHVALESLGKFLCGRTRATHRIN